MRITVRLFATFRQGRFAQAEREVASGTTVADLLGSLEIAEDEIGMLFNRGRHVEVDHVLAEGDVIGIFPLVGGG